MPSPTLIYERMPSKEEFVLKNPMAQHYTNNNKSYDKDK
jgi:hypothetical protein